MRLPYQQASTAQRALAVDHLHQRLRVHFPTLRAGTWTHALTKYQPDLWLVGSAVALTETDLTQLAQHLAAAPELPVLDPPLYGLPALHLAQHHLQTNELAAWAIGEVVAIARACGPRLYALLCHLAHPGALAEQVVQAWCWNLAPWTFPTPCADCENLVLIDKRWWEFPPFSDRFYPETFVWHSYSVPVQV